MKFNASGPGVSGEFYQKRLFIFLTKQFENSSLINGIGRREILESSSRARLPPAPYDAKLGHRD